MESERELEELVATLDAQRDKVIVTTNGVFDILHIGHVRYLEAAKALGDILVVAVNADASVRENKGPTRPFNPAENRMAVLRALKCVDYVTVFTEKTPVEILRKLRPHIHVKGGDYTLEGIIEREEVEAMGGKVMVLDKVDTRSTTEIAHTIYTTLRDTKDQKGV